MLKSVKSVEPLMLIAYAFMSPVVNLETAFAHSRDSIYTHASGETADLLMSLWAKIGKSNHAINVWCLAKTSPCSTLMVSLSVCA
jgi:hypothetical protein